MVFRRQKCDDDCAAEDADDADDEVGEGRVQDARVVIGFFVDEIVVEVAVVDVVVFVSCNSQCQDGD